eukprot:5663734-Prymnesium_polylepis.1
MARQHFFTSPVLYVMLARILILKLKKVGPAKTAGMVDAGSRHRHRPSISIFVHKMASLDDLATAAATTET